MNGILRRIANHRALLVGDAAGAVSPLTAGGIDAAFRLSSFASECIVHDAVDRYSGDRFRTRFIARRWMRRAISAVSSALLLECACAMLRLPGMRRLAEEIFFARRSFPDAAVPADSGQAAEPVGERRLLVPGGQVGD